jgi:phospholipase C
MPTDPIEHVVVLMLENHSFDQMLGGLKAVIPDVDGVDPAAPGQNTDADGKTYAQVETTATSIKDDPKHDLEYVLHQLEGGNSNFVRDFSQAYPESTPEERGQIMGYFPPGSLAPLHELARYFTVCDRWFSSVPGPTWTNRFFVHSGTSLGRVKMPQDAEDGIRDPSLYFGYNQDTIYDRLNEQNISWRIYHGDIPQSMVLEHQWTPRNATHYEFMGVFFTDVQGQEQHFPAFSFIEPSYYPPAQNDDHPPHTTVRAQALLAHVYNALRRNDSLWQSTLLVVVYDEHGGFYDHVSPPNAVRPDNHQSPERFAFDRLGVRVPAVLVSPWVGQTVIHEQFDHTSLLRYLSDKWNLRPLTERVVRAESISIALRPDSPPREDTPASLVVPTESAAVATGKLLAEESGDLNPQQKALVAFSEYLEQQIVDPVGKPARGMAMMGAPLSQVVVAKDRVNLFLAQQKARARLP